MTHHESQRINKSSLKLAIIFLLILIGIARASTDHLSPLKPFGYQVEEEKTTLALGRDPENYRTIYQHLYDNKPHQFKDILICLIKYFVYSKGVVQEVSFEVIFSLLVNMEKTFTNKEKGYEVCTVDDDFLRVVEDKLPDIDIERILVGKDLPQLLVSLLEMISIHPTGIDPLHSIKKCIIFLENLLVIPGLNTSRIQFENAPMNPLILMKRPRSNYLDGLFQQTNYWNRCEDSSHEIVKELKDFRLMTEDGREFIDLNSMSFHYNFPSDLEWQHVPNSNPIEPIHLTSESPSSKNNDYDDEVEGEIEKWNQIEPIRSGVEDEFGDLKNILDNIKTMKLPSFHNKYICRMGCMDSITFLAKLLVTIGDGLQGRIV